MLFHGTSLECVREIFNEGYLETHPKSQVFPDESGEFVYFFDELRNKYAKELAADQAAFALWKFGHKLRAIIEVDSSDMDQLVISNDPLHEDAVRCSVHVPVACIRNVYVEREDLFQHSNWLRYGAMFMFEREIYKMNNSFFRTDISGRKHLLDQSDIKHLDLIPFDVWSRGSRILDAIEDLSNEAKDLACFCKIDSGNFQHGM